jgi:hypothetical protein
VGRGDRPVAPTVRNRLRTYAELYYLLFSKPGIPIAVIEAKDNNHAVGAGMQEACWIILVRPHLMLSVFSRRDLENLS